MPRPKTRPLLSAHDDQSTSATPDDAISPETIPTNVDAKTWEWARLMAKALQSYGHIADERHPDHDDLVRALTDVIALLVQGVDVLLQFRGWPLAAAAEKAAQAWLHSTGHCPGSPACAVDLVTVYRSLQAGWEKFCRPVEKDASRVSPIESLAELDKLPGISEAQICAVFASGDRNDEEEQKWGPWLYHADGMTPCANHDRLKAARRGEAQVPTKRTTNVQPSGWPRKAPILWLLRQAAELVDGE